MVTRLYAVTLCTLTILSQLVVKPTLDPSIVLVRITMSVTRSSQTMRQKSSWVFTLGPVAQRNRTCKCFARVLLLGPGTNRKGEYNNYCLRRVFTLGPVAHVNRTYTCLRRVFTLGPVAHGIRTCTCLRRVFTLGPRAHGNVAYRCLTRVFTGEQVAYKRLTKVFTGAQVAYKCLTMSFPLGPGAHGNGAYKSLKIERVHPGPK